MPRKSAQILTQLFASGRFRRPVPAPPESRRRWHTHRAGRPAAPRGQSSTSPTRAPIALRSSCRNGDEPLIVYARKQRWKPSPASSKLDADIYGGQRVLLLLRREHQGARSRRHARRHLRALGIDLVLHEHHGLTARPTTTGCRAAEPVEHRGSRTPPVGAGRHRPSPSFLEEGGPVRETRFIPTR